MSKGLHPMLLAAEYTAMRTRARQQQRAARVLLEASLDKLKLRADYAALVLGHTLSPFSADTENSAVAACKHCEYEVGVDATEPREEGVYGRAVTSECPYICSCFQCSDARRVG